MPLIRWVNFKGANGEGGWAGLLIARPECCQRLPLASHHPEARPPHQQACKQNRFQLCSYLGLWFWKVLLALR